MNLLEIRQWFVRVSGNYELVTDETTWADNGANAYISAGQKMLDRMQTTPKSLGRFFKMISAGMYSVTFQDCRSIKEVWAVQSGEGRWKLEKKSMVTLREAFPDMDTIEQGMPLYYTPAVLRAAPELHLESVADFSALTAYLDVNYSSHYAYNGILFLPPADGNYMIEVWGQFYSTVMTADTHESYWSVNHPELLVMATQCVVEKMNRNTEGAKDWLISIQQELEGIDKDLVEEDTPEDEEVLEG